MLNLIKTMSAACAIACEYTTRLEGITLGRAFEKSLDQQVLRSLKKIAKAKEALDEMEKALKDCSNITMDARGVESIEYGGITLKRVKLTYQAKYDPKYKKDPEWVAADNAAKAIKERYLLGKEPKARSFTWSE